MKIRLALETTDGAWRAEVVQQGSQVWYRLIHDGEVQEPLAIATLQRILGEAGIDMADLVDVTEAVGTT